MYADVSPAHAAPRCLVPRANRPARHRRRRTKRLAVRSCNRFRVERLDASSEQHSVRRAWSSKQAEARAKWAGDWLSECGDGEGRRDRDDDASSLLADVRREMLRRLSHRVRGNKNNLFLCTTAVWQFAINEYDMLRYVNTTMAR